MNLTTLGIDLAKTSFSLVGNPAQKEIPLILEDAENGLPMLARQMIQTLW
jgi:hypothetical protein